MKIKNIIITSHIFMTKKKLWQINDGLHPDIEKFTVGNDYLLDRKLLPYDLKASKAHAKMLKDKRVLSDTEYKNAITGLDKILKLWEEGKFHITQEQEDGHTAIEQFLTQKYGDVGKKIHTGRSRNDQALVMIRLYMKEEFQKISKEIEKLGEAFKIKAKENQNVQIPGYTHAQKAMPSSAKMWLESFSDALNDQKPFFEALDKLLNQSPLGSASGFGIANFDTNRKLTSKEMGFKKIQKNPMYCGMSRGHFENQFLQTFSPSILILARFVNDSLLFTMQEFNFISLPENFTTGSSIMPQKRNYDVLEIMRGKINNYFSAQNELQNLCMQLMSGYNRDVQLTKEIFITQIDNIKEILKIAILVVQNLAFNKKSLASSMTQDLFVTEDVYDLVNKGESFRTAYLKIKKELKKD